MFSHCFVRYCGWQAELIRMHCVGPGPCVGGLALRILHYGPGHGPALLYIMGKLRQGDLLRASGGVYHDRLLLRLRGDLQSVYASSQVRASGSQAFMSCLGVER